MTALSEQCCDLAHHACLHACCAPALLHDGTCRLICMSSVSSAYQVIEQAWLLVPAVA